MRDMNWYLDRAKERSEITSDARLAKTLGVAQPNVPNMRKGRHLPSYAVMEHLAELAGVSADEAAVDFARWQAERGGSPAFAAAYERLFRHAAGPAAVALMLLVFATKPADAAGLDTVARNTQQLCNVYYAEYPRTLSMGRGAAKAEHLRSLASGLTIGQMSP